jgi:hypothetical protein
MQADKEAATRRTAQIIFLIILGFFLLQRYAREGKKTKKEAAYSAPALLLIPQSRPLCQHCPLPMPQRLPVKPVLLIEMLQRAAG